MDSRFETSSIFLSLLEDYEAPVFNTHQPDTLTHQIAPPSPSNIDFTTLISTSGINNKIKHLKENLPIETFKNIAPEIHSFVEYLDKVDEHEKILFITDYYSLDNLEKLLKSLSDLCLLISRLPIEKCADFLINTLGTDKINKVISANVEIAFADIKFYLNNPKDQEAFRIFLLSAEQKALKDKIELIRDDIEKTDFLTNTAKLSDYLHGCKPITKKDGSKHYIGDTAYIIFIKIINYDGFRYDRLLVEIQATAKEAIKSKSGTGGLLSIASTWATRSPAANDLYRNIADDKIGPRITLSKTFSI